jgi:hypothetical protein
MSEAVDDAFGSDPTAQQSDVLAHETLSSTAPMSSPTGCSEQVEPPSLVVTIKGNPFSVTPLVVPTTVQSDAEGHEKPSR